MTDEQQPELRWAPLEPKPDNRGRIWLIVGLSVAVLVIVGVLLFLLLPRDGSAAPGESASPSPSSTTTPTASASPTPSASTEPAPDPEPSMTPITTPPPPADPSIDAFRGQVEGWLDDALTGLDIVSASGGQDAVSVIDTLKDDAQRLGELAPPTSIEGAWREGLTAYGQRLSELRTAADSGGSMSGPLDAAVAAANDLRGLVGL